MTPALAGGGECVGLWGWTTKNQNWAGPNRNSTPAVLTFTKGLILTKRGRGKKNLQKSMHQKGRNSTSFSKGNLFSKVEQVSLYTVFAGKNKKTKKKHHLIHSYIRRKQTHAILHWQPHPLAHTLTPSLSHGLIRGWWTWMGWLDWNRQNTSRVRKAPFKKHESMVYFLLRFPCVVAL